MQRQFPTFGIASTLFGLVAALLPIALFVLALFSAGPDTSPDDFTPMFHALGGLVLGIFGAILLSACGAVTAVVAFVRNERRLLPLIGLVLCLLVGAWWVLKFSGF